MPEPLLEVRNVSKSFGGVRALENVDLTIGRGEVHCLIGENGSGKSTLIKIIGGVQSADSGSVMLDGKPLGGTRAIDAIRSGIQIIYQDMSVFPNLTVAENIAVNQMLENGQRGVSWRRMRQTARQALDAIGEDIDLDERVGNLPLARKQIVAISRAMTQNARLIIMDEATSSITREEVNHLFSIIARLKERGVSVIFVSHKFGEVFEISENITVLRDGRNAGTFPARELTNEKLSAVMTGREVAFAPYRCTPAPDDVPLLSVNGLCREGKYRDISFDLCRGEIVGVVGLLGSGRTEVAEALFGLTPADTGTIRIKGNPVALRSPATAIAHGLAFLPEDRAGAGLALDQPIGDNIVVTVLQGLLSRLGLLDPARYKAAAEQGITALRIKTPSAAAPAGSLSGGNQQRVVLAKWLATQPEIFILDGPTIGIDIGSKHSIHQTVRDLAGKGMAILMISDEAQEILDNCSRILVMHRGRILREITDPSGMSADALFDIMSNPGTEAA